MVSVRRSLKSFLTAEEVPRWFGLSIVLIYLVGLGCVAQFGIEQVQKHDAMILDGSARHGAELLREQLSTISGREASASSRAASFRMALSRFAGSMPVDWVRVVDAQGREVASAHALAFVATAVVDGGNTSGASLGNEPRMQSAANRPHMRMALRGAAATPVKGGAVAAGSSSSPVLSATQPSLDEAAPLFLEVRLSSYSLIGSGAGGASRILCMVLVVLGALFVVYRCLREQFRGVSKIANRLSLYSGQLEHELSSLHITDTNDSVTKSWNELVDLTEHLSGSVRHTEATEELSRALKSTGGGLLAEALSAIPDGIVYVAEEGRFEYANTVALHLLGWTDGEEKQCTLADAKSTGLGTEVLELIRSAQRSDGAFDASNEVLSVDEGQEDSTSYRVRIVPVRRGTTDEECVVLIRDVSQQIRSERAREEFITQVTHELRTPLTNIRAYAETLSSGMFDDPNLITECYNVITKETRRLARLIEDILSISQIEVGAIQLVKEDVDLKVLLSDAVRDVRGLADEKNIDLQVVLPSKAETLKADRDKLAVVLNNLLGNAIKYTPEGGNVVVACQFANDEVALTVKDNGLGIDGADQARIFEKFQRGVDPEAQKETGTGIGLYTARELVRGHGGSIELVSEKGMGSTFLVHLPRQRSRATTMNTSEEA